MDSIREREVKINEITIKEKKEMYRNRNVTKLEMVTSTFWKLFLIRIYEFAFLLFEGKFTFIIKVDELPILHNLIYDLFKVNFNFHYRSALCILHQGISV